VDDNATNADHIGRLRHAKCGITEQCPPDTFSLPMPVHGQARQYGDRNGFGHVPPEPARSAFDRDRAGSQRIIADHTLAFASNIGPRSSAYLIGAGAPPQPIVKGGLSRTEILDVVVIRQ